jgi:hypothetical protein
MDKFLRGVALVVIVAVFAGVLFLALDTPLGSTRETTGVVKATTVVPNNTGPSKLAATVVLTEGAEVSASVLAGLFVAPGQAVHVVEYSGLFTGTKVYGVVALKDAQ